LDQVRAGTARRITRPGHVFSRIHVADIAGALEASIGRPDPGAIYNLCDDEPAPSSDVVGFACRLLGVEPPPEIPLEQAQLSEMALSFYGESRRVSNARIKRELGFELLYPTYREGLTALTAVDERLSPGPR
jgi:nucleoside-diphosphate-sugar epimerase